MCLPCTPGYACPPGSTTPLPCPASTFSTSTSLADLEQCDPCIPGHSCAIGTNQPFPCEPGTFAAAGAEKCSVCGAGTFQDASGSGGCIRCPLGSFCPQGSTQPQPCAAGTAGTVVGLISQEECTNCPVGTHTNSTGMSACDPCVLLHHMSKL